jgi:hypothetical protein
VRREHDVFLILAHATFKCVRLARMVFIHALGLWPAKWIHRRDEKKFLNARSDGAIKSLFHELRMQLELPVVDANHINRGIDACQRLAN